MTARFKISLGITRFNLFILLHIEAVIKDRTIKKTDPLRTLPIKENSYDLAEHYIHDSTVSLTEIAFVLGYSEYSSFWRAYKRWTKISPSEIRKLEQNIYEET